MNPEYINALNNRGNLWRELGRMEEGLADYARVIQLDPKNATAYYNRAIVFNELSQLEEALSDYNQAIECDPGYASAYNNRGVLFKNLNRFEEALVDYNKAIALNPKSAGAYNNRALEFHDHGLYDEAICDYEKAFALIKDDSSNVHYNIIIENYASTLLILHEFDRAENILQYLSVPLREDLLEFKSLMHNLYDAEKKLIVQQRSQETTLCEAAAKGDIAEIEKKKHNLNQRNPEGKTPLVIAVEHKQKTFVEKLLEAGADINIPSLSSIRSNMQMANESPLLLTVGAKTADGKDVLVIPNISYQHTPISMACSPLAEDFSICEMLLMQRPKMSSLQVVEDAVVDCPASIEKEGSFHVAVVASFEQLIGSYHNKYYYNGGILSRYRTGLLGDRKVKIEQFYYEKNELKKEKLEALYTSREDIFLETHLFFLFEALVIMKKWSLKDDFPLKYSLKNQQEISDFFKKEFLLCLEAYRAFNDNLGIHNIRLEKRDDGIFHSLNEAHVYNVHKKISKLRVGETYVYPTGYPSFEVEHRFLVFLPPYAREQIMGHSVYATFSKVENDYQQEVVQVRIDNLGSGSEKHLDEKGKRDILNREPTCAISPCLMLIGPDDNRLYQYLFNISQARFDDSFDKSSRENYPLEKIYPSPCERNNYWALENRQLVDNCVTANYLVGLHLRLHELQNKLDHRNDSKDTALQLFNWMEDHLCGQAGKYEKRATRARFALEKQTVSGFSL